MTSKDGLLLSNCPSLPSLPFPSQSESRLGHVSDGRPICLPSRSRVSHPRFFPNSNRTFSPPLCPYLATLMSSSSGAIGGTSAFDERTKPRDVVQRCHRSDRQADRSGKASISSSIDHMMLILRLRLSEIYLLMRMSSLQK